MAYDQGVGRSIWYFCKGHPEKVSEHISNFSSARQDALWRGIGVACSYVGGINENILKELSAFSNNHQTQLATGAALAARSRIEANAITNYVELTCNIWCHLSAQEAMSLTVKAEPSSKVNHNEAYSTWLSRIETEIVSCRSK